MPSPYKKPSFIMLLCCLISIKPLVGQTTPSLLWQGTTGGVIFSTPSVGDDGVIYVGSNDNHLHAFYANGSPKWSYETGNWVDSTPTIGEDGTIYVGSWDNKLHAVNRADGSAKWTYETNNYITSSPTISSSGLICFGSKDSVFYALNQDGSLAWEYFAGDPVYASAAVGEDGTIYFGDEGGVFHALNSDGSLKWTYETEVINDTNNSILSSPAIDSLGNLYFGSGNGYCYSLSDNGESSSLNWQYLTGDRVDSSPVLGLNDDVFFAGRDGYLRSLPTFSTTTENVANWEVLVGDVFYSSPVVDSNGQVYVIAYAGGGENHLFCYSSTGTKVWDSSESDFPFTIDAVVDSSLTLTNEGTLLFGCYDYKLYSVSLLDGIAGSDWPTLQRSIKRDGAWPSYTVTMVNNPSNAGQVSGAGTFAQGSEITLNAQPAVNHQFVNWINDSNPLSAENPYTFNLTSNLEITANFVETFSLSISAGQGGTVSPTETQTHTNGSSVAISATPNTGYSFSHWAGDGISDVNDPSTTIDMTGNRNVSAVFTINSYSLQVLAGNGGTVSGSGTFEYGTLAQITATPNIGYSFQAWDGEEITDSTEQNTTVLIHANRSISATFSINSHSLGISATGQGTVSQSGSGDYDYGSNPTISATPATGYSFSHWVGDGVSDINSSSTTVDMTEDRNISAVFTINPYSLEVIAGNGGTASGSGTFEYGTLAQITATPSTGYSFLTWDGDGITNSNERNTTVLINGNLSISATFSTNSHSLEISTTGQGTVSQSGNGNYNYGSNPTISAIPASGYSFSHWVGDGVSDVNDPSTTVDMTENRNVSAVFTINSHSLEVFSGNGGTTSGSGTFEYGTLAQITATPNTGYSFQAWDGEGITNPTEQNTTILIHANRTATATFSINSHTLTISSNGEGNASQSGSGTYDYGSSPTISATPASGYSFSHWVGNGVSDINASSTTVDMTEDRNITSYFIPIPLEKYLLIISSEPPAGGITSGANQYNENTEANISATAQNGYSFIGWSGGTFASANEANTNIIVDQDLNITAHFSINSYTLSIDINGSGSVLGADSYNYDSVAEISASPNPGYSFSRWSGNGISNPTRANTSVIMDQDLNITAHFSINSHTLSIDKNGSGSVTGANLYTYDSVAEISASPNPGYSFSHWSGNGISNPTGANTSVIMDQDLNITAHFSINSYTLSIGINGGGSVLGADSYNYDSVAEISASPNPGYSFSHWSGNGISNPTSANTSVIMDQDLNITAHFSINSHTLSIGKNGSGSVTGANLYTYDSVAEISASPNPGYSFSHWSGEGISNPANPNTSITINQDINITANFVKLSLDLNVSVIEGGEVTTLGTLEYGSTISLQATALEGWEFSQWTGSSVQNPLASSTSLILEENSSVNAVFKEFLGFGQADGLDIFYREKMVGCFITQLAGFTQNLHMQKMNIGVGIDS